eukprot:14393264-Ditylum_brightwellii.AAC.1
MTPTPKLPEGYQQCGWKCICTEILGVPTPMQCIIPNITYWVMWGNLLGGEFLLALLRDTYH